MSRVLTSLLLATAGVSVLIASVTLQAQLPVPGVSLKISNETVSPGGLVQAKVFVTEPKPISTADATFSFGGFDSIVGIALVSPARDALGVAVVRGSQLTLSMLSPSASWGMDPDYPVLTVAGRVAATTPIGTTFALNMDAGSLRFTDASGAVYPTGVRAGSLSVAPNVGVDDVTPGSADVAAGDVIEVLGRGFAVDTKVKVKEVLLSDVTYVDASHMQVTVAQPTHMNGAGILVTNRDGTQTKYFSYQRTVRQATSFNPTLHDAVPVFPDVDVTSALVDVKGQSTGLAIQNRRGASVFVSAALLDVNGSRIAAASVEIRSGHFLLLELSELFGVPYSPSQTVRVRSAAPIQVMGVAVDAAGGATPLAIR